MEIVNSKILFASVLYTELLALINFFSSLSAFIFKTLIVINTIQIKFSKFSLKMSLLSLFIIYQSIYYLNIFNIYYYFN